MWVWSLGQEEPLEEEMATHSSLLAWRIAWTEEPGGLQPLGLQQVGHDLLRAHTHKELRPVCPLGQHGCKRRLWQLTVPFEPSRWSLVSAPSRRLLGTHLWLSRWMYGAELWGREHCEQPSRLGRGRWRPGSCQTAWADVQSSLFWVGCWQEVEVKLRRVFQKPYLEEGRTRVRLS